MHCYTALAVLLRVRRKCKLHKRSHTSWTKQRHNYAETRRRCVAKRTARSSMAEWLEKRRHASATCHTSSAWDIWSKTHTWNCNTNIVHKDTGSWHVTIQRFTACRQVGNIEVQQSIATAYRRPRSRDVQVSILLQMSSDVRNTNKSQIRDVRFFSARFDSMVTAQVAAAAVAKPFLSLPPWLEQPMNGCTLTTGRKWLQDGSFNEWKGLLK